MTTSCYTVPPVESDYVPLGTTEKFDDLDVYVSKPTNESKPFKKAIIVGHDVYEFRPNTKQFCDLLSKAGYLAVFPGYFRGKTAEVESQGLHTLINFINQNFPLEVVVNDTLNVINHLRSEYGSKDFGYVGFCWGGILGSKLCSVKDFDACVLIHYGSVQVGDFEKSQCPVAFLPSREDQDPQPFIDAMKDKPFAEKNFQNRFNDMNHGFAASRGNWKDPLIEKRVNEVLEITTKFFHDNLGCN
ncbi:hypothetical protein RclHR1_09210011 [Rhizophagus clarus]|uniref:Dienelactone hydrolase n=1 Tax=Rhizophagus clarus TaxID=94130 RepID=A0A2Z6SI20_9GLOM|nr:hypothetical protein RclHR1_09210011 [Rhizophagus clarus]GES94200.1 dienelactone hydrolase [Rhizophagus clarus]